MPRFSLPLLALLLLVPSTALAQGGPSSAAERPEVVDDSPLIELDREVVAILAIHGEIGVIDGRENGEEVTGLYGPTVHLRGYVGYDLVHAVGLRVTMGYAGHVGYGYDTITAPVPTEVVLTRHMLAFTGNVTGVTGLLGLGVSTMYAPEYDAALVGVTLQAEVGWNVDGFWIGIPFGVDFWPDWGIWGSTLGLSIGWASI